MGGDISAVIPSARRRPRTFPCLVNAGSRTVPQSFPFGSLRLPQMPLGGFATSRSPLAAVAARGAEDNINDNDRSLATNLIQC